MYSEYNCVQTGAQRQFGATDPEPHGDGGAPAHVQPHQQVHVRLPEPHLRVRRRHLPRSQPWSVPDKRALLYSSINNTTR
jgi:hypothetical protein